MGNFPFGTTGD